MKSKDVLSKGQVDSKISNRSSNFAKNLTKKKDNVNPFHKNLNTTDLSFKTRRKLTIKYLDLSQKIQKVS